MQGVHASYRGTYSVTGRFMDYVGFWDTTQVRDNQMERKKKHEVVAEVAR